MVAPETALTADVDAILARVTPATRMVFLANPNNPTGTYLGFDEVKRLRAALPDNVLLVLDAAYAEYVRANDYEAGIELVATTPNTVMTRTFSKIYGLASLRIGWAYCPDASRRCAEPHQGPVQCVRAGHRRRRRRASGPGRAWRARRSTTSSGAGAWPRRSPRSASRVTPSAANFLLLHFPKADGRSAADADKFLQSRRIILRRVVEYGFPDALRMTIGTEADNRAVLDALEAFMAAKAPAANDRAPVRHDCHYRPWPDRLVHRPRRPRARRRARDRGHRALAADAHSASIELGIADRVVETNAEAVEGADLVIVCVPVGICGAVAEGDRPASQGRRHGFGCGLGKGLDRSRHGPASARRPFISSRPIRSPAPSIPVPMPALPSCSRTAGAS